AGRRCANGGACEGLVEGLHNQEQRRSAERSAWVWYRRREKIRVWRSVRSGRLQRPAREPYQVHYLRKRLMGESFDAFRYMSYLRARWRWIASSAGVAVVLAIVVSMLLPNQYTSTARLLIEPPAGTDMRSAMAVSPIYL